jgi:hypothetical protein
VFLLPQQKPKSPVSNEKYRGANLYEINNKHLRTKIPIMREAILQPVKIVIICVSNDFSPTMSTFSLSFHAFLADVFWKTTSCHRFTVQFIRSIVSPTPSSRFYKLSRPPGLIHFAPPRLYTETFKTNSGLHQSIIVVLDEDGADIKIIVMFLKIKKNSRSRFNQQKGKVECS